jgi:hypothetical protein
MATAHKIGTTAHKVGTAAVEQPSTQPEDSSTVEMSFMATPHKVGTAPVKHTPTPQPLPSPQQGRIVSNVIASLVNGSGTNGYITAKDKTITATGNDNDNVKKRKFVEAAEPQAPKNKYTHQEEIVHMLTQKLAKLSLQSKNQRNKLALAVAENNRLVNVVRDLRLLSEHSQVILKRKNAERLAATTLEHQKREHNKAVETQNTELKRENKTLKQQKAAVQQQNEVLTNELTETNEELRQAEAKLHKLQSSSMLLAPGNGKPNGQIDHLLQKKWTKVAMQHTHFFCYVWHCHRRPSNFTLVNVNPIPFFSWCVPSSALFSNYPRRMLLLHHLQ